MFFQRRNSSELPPFTLFLSFLHVLNTSTDDESAACSHDLTKEVKVTGIYNERHDRSFDERRRRKQQILFPHIDHRTMTWPASTIAYLLLVLPRKFVS